MDPRVADAGPKTKQANLSPLMVAMQRASVGEKVNFCPFNCPDDELDERGLCDHLVGYTTDGRVMEPLLLVKGRKTVQAPPGPDGKTRGTPIPPGAKLVRITTTSRVYFQGKEPPAKKES